MDNVQTVALAKVVPEALLKVARGGLAPGVHDVDLTVRLHGQIKVGEDFDVAPTVSIPIKEALAAVIVYAGLHTSQALLDGLVDALYDQLAETDGNRGQGAISNAIPMVDAALAIVQQRLIDRLPRAYRQGKVTTRGLQLTEIAEAPAEQELQFV